MIDALGAKSPAKILRRLSSILDLLIRPGIPAAANDPGAPDDAVKAANPAPAQIAPSAMVDPAPESTPDGSGIDIALWDQGIDGLLQERVPVGSERDYLGSGAIWVAAFLASGLVGSELNERPPAGSPSSRKPRRAAGVASQAAEPPRSTL